MKKLLLLIILLPILIKAQSPRDNLLGHYVGMERRTAIGDSSYTECISVLNLIPDTNYPVIHVEDSTCILSSFPYWDFVVFDDSTITTDFNDLAGHLFPNDSLYFITWDAFGAAYKYEFFGFKQYGFPAPIGIKNQKKKISFTISPNPFNDYISIQFGSSNLRASKVKLFNSIGQLIKEQNIEQASVFSELQTEDLPSGMYLLELQTTDGIQRIKVVKE